jgi:hypothetical protein
VVLHPGGVLEISRPEGDVHPVPSKRAKDEPAFGSNFADSKRKPRTDAPESKTPEPEPGPNLKRERVDFLNRFNEYPKIRKEAEGWYREKRLEQGFDSSKEAIQEAKKGAIEFGLKEVAGAKKTQEAQEDKRKSNARRPS